MPEFTKISLLVGLMATVPACAGGDGRYPSLAMRPFETGVAPAAPAPPPAPIRSEMSPAMLAALRDQATSAHAGFLARESATERLVRAAAGQSVESNAYAAAMVGLAELTSQHGATSSALAEIDLLVAEAATVLSPDPALTAVQAEVVALLARENAGLERLWGVIGS